MPRFATLLAVAPSAPKLSALSPKHDEALTLIEGGRTVGVPPILFEKLSAEWVETNRAKFAGDK